MMVQPEDPTRANDDGPKYKAFLSNARPLYIPSCKIEQLLPLDEKYRKETENWLSNQGIQYDFSDVRFARYESKTKGKLSCKTQSYTKNRYNLFVESDLSAIQTTKPPKNLSLHRKF